MLRSASRGLRPMRLAPLPRSQAALAPLACDNRLVPFSAQLGAVRHGSGGVGAPIIRLLANLVMMGSGVVGRAFVEAYQQALKNGGQAASSGAGRGAARASANEMEARQILNVGPKATREEVLEAAERLIKMNEQTRGGSVYLQAKIAFARDALVKPEPQADASASEAEKPPGDEGKPKK